MTAAVRRVGVWWLALLALWLLPLVLLLPLGLWWLHERGLLLVWSLVLLVLGGLGILLQWWLRRSQRLALAAARTGPDPVWSPRAAAAWAGVESLADSLNPEDWPITDGARLLKLAQQTFEQVAAQFHPDVEQPLLELTLPHGLLILERASRDLRETLVDGLPLSHSLTVGTFARVYRWKPFAERLLSLYRAGRWVVNPSQAAVSEAWSRLRGQAFTIAQRDLYQWLLREYVRKIGTYAIELYSGQLLLTAADPTALVTPDSLRDLLAADATAADPPAGEPLRILVLGRANAGKSSLINALFGQLRAATDLLPETTRATTPYLLERDGLELALVYDTSAAERLSAKRLGEFARTADMVLWVSAAHRPDRHAERQILDALRAAQAAQVDRQVPPLLVVVTHIDRLRPLRDWQPPYDLTDSRNLKAMSIQAAVAALAADLAVPIATVIPVCLAEQRLYNVEDSLWAAILNALDRAQRSRLLRCQGVRRREENWTLLRRQLANAGRFLLALPQHGQSPSGG